VRYEFLYLNFNGFVVPRIASRGIETDWKMSLVVSYCSVNLPLCKAPYISKISVGQNCAAQDCSLQLGIGEVSKGYWPLRR
jgi:hypothetical protein